MRESDRDLLADMLDHAEFAIQLIGAEPASAIATDRAKFSSLCHEVQTIGEAANGVSKEIQSILVDIPWQKVIGIRHRIVHGYRTVAPGIVIAAVRNDLPPLIAALRAALEENPS